MPSVAQGVLDEIFANRLVESHEFRSWLLSRTKFAKLWPHARLLIDEQAAARDGKLWWKSWWRRVPEFESDSGTPIFLVFEVENTNLRFALHIQSAAESGLEERCGETIRTRAVQMMRRERFLDYTDFETVLLAPKAIISDPRTLAFDRRIPFETIAGFVPQFGRGERNAA